MTTEKLLNAQYLSVQLFKAIEESNLIVAGKSEEQLTADVCDLALKRFGIEKHWHKKIVRSGKNTLAIYPDNPPNRIIDKDDILFLFGQNSSLGQWGQCTLVAMTEQLSEG